MKILITGRAGSGKTAVASELRKRGFNSFDADEVPGLCSWFDISNNTPVILSNQKYVDLNLYIFRWNEKCLKKLLKDNQDIFLCGGASNDLSFSQFFDKSFVLDVTPENQHKRLASRTNNDYGTDPKMIPTILNSQKEHIVKACDIGSIRLNANKPVDKVINEILSHVDR